MFGKFDEEAQKVLVNAKKEMQELKHEYVGTEHLMLGILKSENIVSDLLNKYNVSYDKFRENLIDMVGIGKCANDLFLYTPLLKRVLESSINDSKDSGGIVYINNLFYSIIEEGEGVAIRVLLKMNIDIDRIYNEISKNIPKKRYGKKKMILDELGIDLNKKAKEGLIDPVIGRDDEIKRIIEILCRRTKNNPILIGSAGVGKTAIVECLASRIVSGDVPSVLLNKKIISLDMASSVAGTKYRGEFEDRMKKVLNELENNEDIILFIDEIHTIMGAGGAEGAIDASNIFKPALARGKMRCIGATTTDEYKKFIENDGALDRRFQKLEVKEPDKKTVKSILMKLKEIYEIHHGVVISEKMIDKIIYYSSKYIRGRNEPDKSIDILDEVCSKVSLKINSNELKLRKMKESLRETIINKNKYIIENDFKKAYKLKMEEDSISSSINNLELKKNNSIKTVFEKDIIEVVKSKTNMPILSLDSNYLDIMRTELNNSVIGQEACIERLLSISKRINYDDKCLSLLMCGNSGVGKTLLAKRFGELLVGKDNVIKLDMSEFSESHSISKIIGAPPGYVGYSDTKNILEEIKDKPNAVIILDEIEKCSRNVLNLFIQGIDEGKIKDSKGKIIYLDNVTVIMISNINIDNISLGFNNSKSSVKDKLKVSLGSDLINRVTKIIELNILSDNDIKNIIYKEIDSLKSKYNISLNIDDKVINNIVELSEYKVSGARKIKEIISNNIEDVIIDNVLDNINNIVIDSLNMVTN